MITAYNVKVGEIVRFDCPCGKRHEMVYEEGDKWEIRCSCGEIWVVVLKDLARLK